MSKSVDEIPEEKRGPVQLEKEDVRTETEQDISSSDDISMPNFDDVEFFPDVYIPVLVDNDEIYEKIWNKESIDVSNSILEGFSLSEFRRKYEMEPDAPIDIIGFHANGTTFRSVPDIDNISGLALDLANCKITGVVNFNDAKFSTGGVDFSQVEFAGHGVLFRNCKFGDGDIKFAHCKFGDGNIVFSNSQFGDGNKDFSYVKFGSGKVDFKKIQFGSGNIDFARAVFGNGEKDFSYSNITSGDILFLSTKFNTGNVYFMGSKFGDGNIDFFRAKFGDGNIDMSYINYGKGNINFSSVKFGNGDAIFFNSSFSDGELNFCKAVFGDGNKDFSKSTLGSGKVDFSKAKFGEGPIDFSGVNFGVGHVDFSSVKNNSSRIDFSSGIVEAGDLDFDESDFSKSFLVFNKFKFNQNKVSFYNCRIRKASFHSCQFNNYTDFRVAECQLLDLRNTIFRDVIDLKPDTKARVKIETLILAETKNSGTIFNDWKENNVKNWILSQEGTSSSQKAEQYRLLKENYRNIGQYEDEDLSYVEFKRHEMKAILLRNQMKHRNSKLKKGFDWVKYFFKWLVYDQTGKYGTSPGRVLMSMFYVFLAFTILYYISQGIPHFESNTGMNADPTVEYATTLVDSIYFSAYNLLIIGYEDYHPAGFTGFLSVVESFLGLFLMSFFTVAFVRKILR
jgi:ion channel